MTAVNPRDDAALHRALIENSPEVVTVLGAEGVILYQSPSIESQLGYDALELVGRPVLDYVHEDDRALVTDALAWLDTAEESGEAAFRFRHKDGRWIYFEGLGRAIKHGGQHLFVVYSRDMTHVREALERSEAARILFERVFSTSRLLKSVTRPDDGRILLVNDTWLKTLGWSRTDAVGARTTDLRLWGDDEHERDRLHAVLARDGRLRDEETTIYTRDGDARTVRLDAEMLELDGEPCVLASCLDITEELRVQAQLRQSQKMEALGQLTGGVAHDFNNLLGVLMGNGELLREHCEGDEEALEYADAILEASQRGAALTEQLLAFARRQALTPEAVEVRSKIERLRPMLQASVNDNVCVRIEAGHEPWTCRVDPGQLENALLNLVINARDAMPAGGAILIHASNRSVPEPLSIAGGELAAGDYVAVSVADTGIGIDADTLAHVFEPFFTTKAPGKGTGLGLSMVFGFATQSGGGIDISSTPGEGTTVTLLLPRMKGEPENARPRELPAAGMPRARGETVLLLEDNDELRVLLREQLRRLGYAVLEARDERELTSHVNGDAPFDLLVSDIVLSGTRLGTELARAVSHRRPDTAVLFISGYQSWAQDLESDMRVLRKPFRMDAFAHAVRDALSERETPREAVRTP